MRPLGHDRVAGYDADVVLLKAKDSIRFSQRLWSERQTGLLLRAEVLGANGQVLESVGFSELQLGIRPQIDALQAQVRRLDGYRVARPVLLPVSRKDFIGAITGRAPRERLAGTLAAIAHTLTLTRAGIYRVHDVQDVRNFLDVWDVLQGHAELSPDALLDRVAVARPVGQAEHRQTADVWAGVGDHPLGDALPHRRGGRGAMGDPAQPRGAARPDRRGGC